MKEVAPGPRGGLSGSLARVSRISSEHHSIIVVGTCPEVQRDGQVLLCEWRRVLLHRGHQPALLQVSDLQGWAQGREQGRKCWGRSGGL